MGGRRGAIGIGPRPATSGGGATAAMNRRGASDEHYSVRVSACLLSLCTTNVASSPLDTRQQPRATRVTRYEDSDATLIRDVSHLVLFGLFMHACMGGVARPPAHTARRAGAPTAQQLCLPWKTTNLALTR